MSDFSRRDILKTGIGISTGMFGGTSLLNWAQAWADQIPFQPETGAKLRVLRFQRFVESEDIQFEKNLVTFTETTGIPIQLEKEWLDDIQPKASVAANVSISQIVDVKKDDIGQGPSRAGLRLPTIWLGRGNLNHTGTKDTQEDLMNSFHLVTWTSDLYQSPALAAIAYLANFSLVLLNWFPPGISG